MALLRRLGGFSSKQYDTDQIDAFYYWPGRTTIPRRLNGFQNLQHTMDRPLTPVPGLGGTNHTHTQGILSITGTFMVLRTTYYDMLQIHDGEGALQRMDNSYAFAITDLGKTRGVSLIFGVHATPTGEQVVGSNNLNFGTNTSLEVLAAAQNSGVVANFEVLTGVTIGTENSSVGLEGNPLSNVEISFAATQKTLISGETTEEVVSNIINVANMQPAYLS